VNETLTGAAKAVVITAKIKALIAALSFLLLCGGLYTLADPVGQSTAAKDPYTLDIQARTELVNNTVLGVVDAQGKEPAYKYQVTCENAVYVIRKDNLEAQQEVTTLSQDQRALNAKYKAYLHEAYLVVDDAYNGKKADLTKMNAAKATLS